MSDEDYSAYLKKQSYDDLVSIIYSTDKEAHADRYEKVLAEMAVREKRGEKPEAMSTLQSPIEKPSVIKTATMLLCTSIAIVFVGCFWLAFHHSPMGSAMFSLLVMTWLTYKIHRGRNWDRITFLVLSLFGAVVWILLLLLVPASRVSGGALIIEIVQIVLQIAALILLFSRAARPWFHPFITTG